MGGTSRFDNGLQLLARVWLENHHPNLDEIGLKIAQHQEESMQNRRALAEATCDFRRRRPETAVGDLLKQYQQEVDRLTKRAKHGESAFLDLYQRLYKAPDPAPALANGLESASRILQLEAQVGQTTHELAEYKAESKEIKNQEQTIRRLEKKIQSLESHFEGKSRDLEDMRREATQVPRQKCRTVKQGLPQCWKNLNRASKQCANYTLLPRISPSRFSPSQTENVQGTELSWILLHPK